MSALLAAPLSAKESGAPVAKQLSGPPSEIAAMRAVDPVEATIHSKSALLPVRFATSKSGERSWSGALPVENGALRFLTFSGADAGWQVDLVAPSGRVMPAASLAKRALRTDFGLDDARVPASQYEFAGLQNGSWTLKLRGNAGARDGFVLIEGDDATELASYQTHKRQRVGERIGLTALLTATREDDSVLLGKAAGRIDSAVLRVTAPDGAQTTYPMFDDGRHGDGDASDGLFGGDFPAKAAGSHLAQVEIRGTNLRGQGFVRTAEHLLPVIETTLVLDASKAAATATDDTRLAIRVPVTAKQAGQHYRAIGEVWGTNAKGEAIPVAWLGGMVTPADGALELGFDERWVAKAAARAPFELRNLRIEDADHFVTVASAEKLALELPALRTKAAPADIAIDEVMTMGPRPTAEKSAKGVGKRLILVHGYCSGGVWPQSQFATSSTFLDVNQNRSHDQFAIRIRDFGATWNSFGTVAHSQGGAASLHLYTYYWSGLDNATGSRLIQSVGTPYKGTNLSGILATIGNWFGVACGSNSNMTYSGASSWLAGIPTSARAKVNYYTTSFRSTNWYTNDYCNIASDLVLSDPEDGTTEQVNGQLPGAVNRGHVTGQCHTAGMRDPAQYNDSGRNATMSANAAR
nr:choice-of-anchor X domain-containing protein [Chiayiivirga flava]